MTVSAVDDVIVPVWFPEDGGCTVGEPIPALEEVPEHVPDELAVTFCQKPTQRELAAFEARYLLKVDHYTAIADFYTFRIKDGRKRGTSSQFWPENPPCVE